MLRGVDGWHWRTASNALFALAAADALGVDPRAAAAAIERIADVGGRYVPFAVDGRQVLLFLVKNPASWNEAISLAATGAPVVFALEPFGIKDMAPQWDVDLGGLQGSTVAISGQRRLDLAVLAELYGVAFDLFADPLGWGGLRYGRTTVLERRAGRAASP